MYGKIVKLIFRRLMKTIKSQISSTKFGAWNFHNFLKKVITCINGWSLISNRLNLTHSLVYAKPVWRQSTRSLLQPMAESWGFKLTGKWRSVSDSPRPQSRSMTPENKKNKRLVALFLFGFVLLNYPILSLFNINITVFGLPLLYIYTFGVWGLLIFLSALAMSRSRQALNNSEKPGN